MKQLSFQEFIHYIKSINIILKEKVRSSQYGSHSSANRGYDEDNIEYRKYQIGDDLRYIDWKIFARTEKYYLREGYQNTSRNILIWLDSSPSQFFFQEKFHYNYLLALGIAYLFKMQNDKVFIYSRFLSQDIDFIKNIIQLDQAYQLYLNWIRKSAKHKANDRYNQSDVQDSNKIVSFLKKNSSIFWITDMYIKNQDFCKIIHNIKKQQIFMKVLHIYDTMEWGILSKKQNNIFAKYVDVENKDWISFSKIQNYKNIWEESIKNRIKILQSYNVPYFAGLLENGPIKIIRNLV